MVRLDKEELEALAGAQKVVAQSKRELAKMPEAQERGTALARLNSRLNRLEKLLAVVQA